MTENERVLRELQEELIARRDQFSKPSLREFMATQANAIGALLDERADIRDAARAALMVPDTEGSRTGVLRKIMEWTSR